MEYGSAEHLDCCLTSIARLNLVRTAYYHSFAITIQFWTWFLSWFCINLMYKEIEYGGTKKLGVKSVSLKG